MAAPTRGTPGYLRVAVLVLCAFALAGCASGPPRTYMLVPGSGTAAALAKLSDRSNIIADVLTTDREEYLLHLDGGGGAFSGQLLDALPQGLPQGQAPGTRIPFERLALVYYLEEPVGAQYALDRPVKGKYPSPAAVGAAEQSLDCPTLDVEVARAGAIRWYARRHSEELPFTAHEARVQHTKTALVDVGVGLAVAAVVVAVAGGGGGPAIFGGGGGWGDSGPPVISQLDYRWALTSADRREVGLLQLKRDRSCPPRAKPRDAGSDLDVLASIESTRRALEAHEISDQEQMKRQTQLLDQLDPSAPPPIVPVASAAEAAERAAGFSIAEGETAVAAYSVEWFAGRNALASFRSLMDSTKNENRLTATLLLTDRSLTLLPQSGGQTTIGESIPLREVASVEITSYGRARAVLIRRRGGQVDSFRLQGMVPNSGTVAAGELLRATVQAQTSGTTSH